MNPRHIASVDAWEVLDSRGNPTVACAVRLFGGAVGHAAVPSGASTGSHEAYELRDGEEHYGGRGVRQAVLNVRDTLGPALEGLDATDSQHIDTLLRETDGTRTLRRLGANAVLAVSIAASMAAAAAEGLPLYRFAMDGESLVLPTPSVNILSGGAHAGNAVDFQDFLLIPLGATSFREALEWAWRVRAATAEIVSARGLPTALVADEGGLGPPLPSNRAALECLATGVEACGLQLGQDVALGIDVAATQLWDGNRYQLTREGRTLDWSELLEELASWCENFPIVSIEDPLTENDWLGWQRATALLGSRCELLGDDLFCTDLERLDRGIEEGVANAVLVKPNQTGTLSDAKAVVERARSAGFGTVLSARSGETEDVWLADLAVAWSTKRIKVGSTTRSERTAKWNRLLRIEHELGGSARFSGAEPFQNRAS